MVQRNFPMSEIESVNLEHFSDIPSRRNPFYPKNLHHLQHLSVYKKALQILNAHNTYHPTISMN